MKKPRTEFGRRLRDARKRAKLTQTQVAELLGMSQGTLSELETAFEGTARVAELAELYECSAVWLATGRGDWKLPPRPRTIEAVDAARMFDEIADPERRANLLACLPARQVAQEAMRV